MADLIVDSDELNDHGGEPTENLTATTEAEESAKVEFFVQMRSWTLSDMESLIVEAAARLLVGNNRDSELTKRIEQRTQELITGKLDDRLIKVTKEIIDQPVTPSYGDKKPVTMRELIGMYGREYLNEIVDLHTGKRVDGYCSNKGTRIQYLVQEQVVRTFDSELGKARAAAVKEIESEYRAKFHAVVEQQKNLMRLALEGLVKEKP